MDIDYDARVKVQTVTLNDLKDGTPFMFGNDEGSDIIWLKCYGDGRVKKVYITDLRDGEVAEATPEEIDRPVRVVEGRFVVDKVQG